MEIEPWRTWCSENLDKLLKEAEMYVRTHGTVQNNTHVNGKEVSSDIGGIPTLLNVQFCINYEWDDAEMDRKVIDKFGWKGLNFLKQEFKEWISYEYTNPGKAWREYPERWKDSLNVFGRMDYSYHERINGYSQMDKVIELLYNCPTTRQAYIDIYRPDIDSERFESNHRIPCLMGYQFNTIGNSLTMTVMARSIDLNNCLLNDIWLAHHLLKYIVFQINDKMDYEKIDAGSITFMIANLHIYPDIVPEVIK